MIRWNPSRRKTPQTFVPDPSEHWHDVDDDYEDESEPLANPYQKFFRELTAEHEQGNHNDMP